MRPILESERKRVLELRAQGLTYRVIAQRLGISLSRVRYALSPIRRIGAQRRAARYQDKLRAQA